MRDRGAWWPAAIAGVAWSLLLGLASAAEARKLQMSGTWEMRHGPILFLPLQWAIVHASPPVFGTMGLGTPNGAVPGRGAVTVTGRSPATLRVPSGRFGGAFSAATALDATVLLQITTALTPMGPAIAASLAPGSGPGSFTWCPGDPACVAGGGMLSTDPPQGAGTRPGRIIYRAGANRFGGVMQMLLAGHLGIAFGVGSGQSLPSSLVLVGSAMLTGLHPTGGPYSAMATWSPQAGYAIATRPLVPPAPGGFVTAPGPKATTMFGVTSTASGPILTFPGSGSIWSGFPFTTGTVFVQQDYAGGYNTFFTLMGSDMRTALGAGNITLVAGGLARETTVFTGPSFGRIRMEFSAPVPSLSASGIAAASALVLLAAGYALRWRR